MEGRDKTLVIQNGTLIDGSGRPAVPNETLVVQGNRIRSVGRMPDDLQPQDRTRVEVIDATGEWILPGLIDAHTHLSYGYPHLNGEGRGRGITRPELGVLKAARSAQQVLRSGVTSLCVPGGTWFTDVGVRDAIKLGVIEGPRIHCAGRMIITYGSIEDDEPSWVGTPEHGVGVLCNTAAEMVTEVRRQCKHGVNFIKMADSRSGDVQTLAQEEIAAVVQEAHRRNARVAIHSRGAASTRAAAAAGVDWIIHADLAGEADLEAVAEAGIPITPTMTFLAMVLEAGDRYGQDVIQLDVSRMKRHFESVVRVVERARTLGIRILAGTDTGNNFFMPFCELHAKQLEILVNFCGFTPMQAIVTATRDNAYAVGLQNEVGILEAGRLADIIILSRDPLADIRVLQGGRHLTHVIKDGHVVKLGEQPLDETQLAFQMATVSR
jgi:imidazolonepropionase-like amidohydrolase